MIAKLTRYALKQQWKELVYFAGISLVAPLLARLFFLLPDTPVNNFMAGLFSGIWIGMIIGGLVAFIVGTFKNFARFNYLDEGYLMHTLPVSKSDLYLSRVLGALLSLVTLTVIFVLSVIIRFAGDPFYEQILTTVRFFLEPTGVSLPVLVFIILLLIDLEAMAIILIGFFSTVFGFRFSSHRILISVLCGIGLYLVFNLGMIAWLWILSFFFPDLTIAFSDASMQAGSLVLPYQFDVIIKAVMAGIVYYVLVDLGFFFAGLHLFKKGVNLE